MKLHLVLALILASSLFVGPATAGALLTPIFDGTNLIPGPVTVGDVVLQEGGTLGTLDRTQWSEVVRFYNFEGQSYGFLVPDGENGVGNISINVSNPATGGTLLLPDALSSNLTFITETAGTVGSDADVTPFLTYAIHSDGTAFEINEPKAPPPDPGAPPVGGGNQQVTIAEAGTDGFTITNFLPVGGVGTIPEGAGTDGNSGEPSDTLNFQAGGVAWHSDKSLPEGNTPDIEIYTGKNEGPIASYVMISPLEVVPEPSSLRLLLLGLGSLGLLSCVRRLRPAAV